MCNFDRGHHEVHFWEIILNLDQWFRRCHIWSSGGEGTICAILVVGFKGNNPVKYFYIWFSGSGRDDVEKNILDRRTDGHMSGRRTRSDHNCSGELKSQQNKNMKKYPACKFKMLKPSKKQKSFFTIYCSIQC